MGIHVYTYLIMKQVFKIAVVGYAYISEYYLMKRRDNDVVF